MAVINKYNNNYYTNFDPDIDIINNYYEQLLNDCTNTNIYLLQRITDNYIIKQDNYEEFINIIKDNVNKKTKTIYKNICTKIKDNSLNINYIKLELQNLYNSFNIIDYIYTKFNKSKNEKIKNIFNTAMSFNIKLYNQDIINTLTQNNKDIFDVIIFYITNYKNTLIKTIQNDKIIIKNIVNSIHNNILEYHNNQIKEIKQINKMDQINYKRIYDFFDKTSFNIYYISFLKKRIQSNINSNINIEYDLVNYIFNNDETKLILNNITNITNSIINNFYNQNILDIINNNKYKSKNKLIKHIFENKLYNPVLFDNYFWSNFNNSSNIIIPKILKIFQNITLDNTKKIYKDKTFTYNYNYSIININLDINEHSYNLDLTFLQYTILKQFSINKDFIDVDTIFNNTKIQKININTILKQFLNIDLIIKNDNKYSINENFYNKNKNIKLETIINISTICQDIIKLITNNKYSKSELYNIIATTYNINDEIIDKAINILIQQNIINDSLSLIDNSDSSDFDSDQDSESDSDQDSDQDSENDQDSESDSGSNNEVQVKKNNVKYFEGEIDSDSDNNYKENKYEKNIIESDSNNKSKVLLEKYKPIKSKKYNIYSYMESDSDSDYDIE